MYKNEKEELDFYRKFFKQMNASLYILQLKPYELTWITDNDCVTRVTGLSAEEVIKQGKEIPRQLLENPDFAESTVIAVEKFIENPDIKWAGVYRIHNADNELKWVIYSSCTFEKNELGIPISATVVAFPLEDVFNTPITINHLHDYLKNNIYNTSVII